jgi:hypothetical protein
MLSLFRKNHGLVLSELNKLPNKLQIIKDLIEQNLVNNASEIEEFETNNPHNADNMWEHSYRQAYSMLCYFTGIDVYELEELDTNKSSKLKKLEAMGYDTLLLMVLL